MKKRLLSLALCVIMALSLLPGTALAADPDYTMDFTMTTPVSWAAYKTPSSDNLSGEGWSWDANNKTLTLNGLSFTTSNEIAIKLPDGAKLVLEGVNTVTSTYSDGSESSYGISALGALTISGTGSLTVTGGEAGSGNSYGVRSNGNVTINGGTITATGGEAGVSSCGVYTTGSVTVSGGTVTATGGEAGVYSYGVYGYSSVTISGGKVTATGGAATGDYGSSYGVYGDTSVTIQDGAALTAVGGYSASGSSYGIGAGKSGVTIDGAATKVVAVGGKAGADSYGVSAKDPGTITYNSGLLVAKGRTAAMSVAVTNSGGASITALSGNATDTNIKYVVYGDGSTYHVVTENVTQATDDVTGHIKWTIDTSNNANPVSLALTNTVIIGADADYTSYALSFGHNLTLSGFNLALAGDSSSLYSAGAYGEGDAVIDGDGSLVAVGGTDSKSSYGVHSGTKITVKDSAVVTAIGGTSNQASVGIIGSSGVSIGGSADVTAIGGSSSANSSFGIYGTNITLGGSGAAVGGSMGSAGYFSQAMYVNPLMTGGYAVSGLSNDKVRTWSMAAYTVTYDDNGATTAHAGGDTSYNIETVGFALPTTAPTKDGYTFKGWKVTTPATDGTTGFKADEVYTGQTVALYGAYGPVTLTAQWEQSGGYVPVTDTLSNSDGTVWLTGKGLTYGDTLVTERNPAGEDYDALRGLAGGSDVFETYNIYLRSGRKSTGSAMYLHFDLDAKYAGQSFTLIHQKADASREYFYSQAADGNVSFGPLYELSPFMLVQGTLTPFADVKQDDWFNGDVAYAYSGGLMQGVSATTFDPHGTTTRGMIVEMLYRLESKPAVTGACPFDDVASGKYYENAVTWAAANNIVDGYGNGKFDPEAPITREQMAVILYRYEQLGGGGFTGAWMFQLDFPDASKVSDWAYEAMCWCTMNGIIGGNSDGTLAPQGNAERCQVAAILHRFCEKIK